MREYIERTAEFYNKYAESYETQTKDLQDQDWLEKLCRGLPQGARVLDAGCGFGRDTAYLSAQGFAAYGLDVSEKLIERAKEAVPGAHFIVGDVLSLPYPDDHFDAICCSALLVHISKKDLPLVLSEFARVAKQGALLYIAAKEGTDEGFVPDPRYDGAEKFYVHFTPEELFQHLRVAGFRKEDLEVRPSRGYRNKNTIYLLARKELLTPHHKHF